MFSHRLTLLAPVVALLACAPKYTRDADTLARAGDWESALTQYRLAAEERPDDFPLQRKVEMAERKVSAIWTKRGEEANREGHLGDAATFWTRALDLLPENEREKSDAWKLIEKNAAALEYFGDSAVAEQRHEDAVGVFGAILKVHPERVELVHKHMEAKKQFATQLFERADGLARQDLLGAALVTDLRALQHDPMQPNAFRAGAELKKTLKTKSKIQISDVKIVDSGFKGLSVALYSVLSPRLDAYPPYGPTRDAEVKATWKATIEEFTKNETKEEGFDELPNVAPAPTEPVPNPAIPEQKAKIAELEKRLANLKREIANDIAARKKTKKQSGRPVDDPGLALARQADATRVELDAAKKSLASLPAKVPPPPPDATWKLAWTKSIRTVEAKIRFEVQESDYAEPIVVTITHKVSKEDRTHKGNELQNVEADPLSLPAWEKMVEELAGRFSNGTEAIAQARDRRVNDLVERGREALEKKNEDAALDAFVQVLFMMGPSALPEDAAKFVATSLEHDRFKDVVAAH